MVMRHKSVAILAGNPAFAALLAKTLESRAGHRVAQFTGIEAMTTYLRITPVDIVLLDGDIAGMPAADLARGLRSHLRLATNLFDIVAIARAADSVRAPLLAAGVDLVLAKPILPHALLEAFEQLSGSRRGQAPALPHAARQFPLVARMAERMGNVIPLFGEGRAPR